MIKRRSSFYQWDTRQEQNGFRISLTGMEINVTTYIISMIHILIKLINSFMNFLCISEKKWSFCQISLKKMAASKTWTRTQKNLDLEKPGPRKTCTLKNQGSEKPGLWKSWTLKNLDLKNLGPWRTWEKAGCRK